MANTWNCLPGLSGSDNLGHVASFMLPSLKLQGKNSGKSNPSTLSVFRHIYRLIEFLTVEMYIFTHCAFSRFLFLELWVPLVLTCNFCSILAKKGKKMEKYYKCKCKIYSTFCLFEIVGVKEPNSSLFKQGLLQPWLTCSKLPGMRGKGKWIEKWQSQPNVSYVWMTGTRDVLE